MTPFRSFVVTVMTALTLTIMALLNLKGGTITYVIVSPYLSSMPTLHQHESKNVGLSSICCWCVLLMSIAGHER